MTARIYGRNCGTEGVELPMKEEKEDKEEEVEKGKKTAT